MSIEPENLSALADEIEGHSNGIDQLGIICGVLEFLDGPHGYDVWKTDLQFLADTFQSIADQTEETLNPRDLTLDPCDFLPSLKVALGRKYARRIGRE